MSCIYFNTNYFQELYKESFVTNYYKRQIIIYKPNGINTLVQISSKHIEIKQNNQEPGHK